MLNVFASCTVIVADKLTSVAGRRRTRLERAARSYVANVTGVELLRVNRLKVSTPYHAPCLFTIQILVVSA